MKKWKYYVPAGMLAFALAAAAMLQMTVKAEMPEDNTIPQRVFFDEIGVGGMTAEEAKAEVEAYVEELGDTEITLSAGKNTIETTAKELGLSWSNPEIIEEAAGLGKSGNLLVRYMAMKDLEHEDRVYGIGFTVEPEKIAAILEENKADMETEAVDAGLTRADGKFEIIPGSQGVTINVEESVTAVQEYMTTQWDRETGQVELVAQVVDPKGTEEELSKVKDVLGSFNTEYASHSTSGRATNIKTGTSRIDGSVVYPGEQFSVYETVSPFTKDNGYELAGAYENGQTVSSYGGGICQVSTTLYNAVIRAELDVVERFPHSMIVTYVDPSADAAIAGTYKDLKFTNNTDAPIYIEGYTSGGNLYFTIYGQDNREAGREVTFVSETTSTTDPGVQFQATDAPIGTISRIQGSHTGKTAKLWKVVTVNGKEVSREVFNTSTYQASPAIYAVGVSSGVGSAEAESNMSAAVATQDEATIRAAAAAWCDEALANTVPTAPTPTDIPAPGTTVPTAPMDPTPMEPTPENPTPPDDSGTTTPPDDSGTTTPPENQNPDGVTQ